MINVWVKPGLDDRRGIGFGLLRLRRPDNSEVVRATPRARVNQFLGQFATGSHALLWYVGLLGAGKLAQALRTPT